jgi:hypothetical protein
MLFKSIIGAALFAVAAVAQTIQFTSTPTTVAVGSTYVLTWQGGDGTTVRNTSHAKPAHC